MNTDLFPTEESGDQTMRFFRTRWLSEGAAEAKTLVPNCNIYI